MASDDTKVSDFNKFNQRNRDGSFNYSEALKARETMTREQVAGTFDKWVENGCYESDTKSMNYNGPKLTADMVATLFESNQENVRILDVAAGSGLLSQELRKRGFQNIDAVDPSPASKEVAMKMKLYTRYIVDFVDDHPLDIKSDEYDCVVSSGGFGPGLMPCVALKEMIRVVKQGGMACFSISYCNFTSFEEYLDKFEQLIDEYVSQGFWEKVWRTSVKDYLENRPGVIFVYKVLTSEVF